MLGISRSLANKKISLRNPTLKTLIPTSISRIPSTSTPSYSTTSSSYAKTKITTLPNGLQIASENLPGHFLSVGVYVDTGTRYETDETMGVSHLMDRMAFKSTKNYSAQDIVQTLEHLGGNMFANSTRETILYQSAIFPNDLEKLVRLYSEMIQNPLFLESDFEETKLSTLYEIIELSQKHDMLLSEHVHALAFRDGVTGKTNTLGRSLICPMEQLEKMKPELLHSYRNMWYTPDRLVVAGVGMEHEKLVDLVGSHFSGMKSLDTNSVAAKTRQDILALKPVYTGGMLLNDTSNDPPSPNPDDIPLTHFHIAFEAPSMSDPDIYALAVLQSLMGGGGSFSAGGPGKGMYTRLYTSVLNRHHWVEACSMFSYSYTDTGLFGITASVPPHPEAHRQVLEVLCMELVNMTNHIQEIELSRAKNQLKSSLLMGLESRIVEVEDIGRQVMVLGHRVDVKTLCSRIDQVTKEDVMRVARRVVLGNDEEAESALKYEWLNELEGTAERDLYKIWNRHGPFRPTVLVHGPFGRSVSEDMIHDVMSRHGIYVDPVYASMHASSGSSSSASASSSSSNRSSSRGKWARKLW